MPAHGAYALPAIAAASIALFFLAAKSHGRQLRLERELEGYHDVDLRSDANPPWVRALWRRDRIWFWTVAPTLALILGGFVVLLRNAILGGLGARATWTMTMIVALLWAPSVAFCANGLNSLRRTHQRRKTRVAPPQWQQAFVRGSSIYWVLCASFAFLVVWLVAT